MTEEKETQEGQEAEASEEEAAAAEEPKAEAGEPEAEAQAPKEAAKTEKDERYTRSQLQRLTTKKLREIGLELGEVVGVHGMKKDELVEAIFKLRGAEEGEGTAEPAAVDKGAIKSEIRELKALRETALQVGNAFELKRVRKRIKRLKRVLRRAS